MHVIMLYNDATSWITRKYVTPLKLLSLMKSNQYQSCRTWNSLSNEYSFINCCLRTDELKDKERIKNSIICIGNCLWSHYFCHALLFQWKVSKKLHGRKKYYSLLFLYWLIRSYLFLTDFYFLVLSIILRIQHTYSLNKIIL